MDIVTIDGPAGAGKTTVSRRVASSLQYTYLDTGAMYRAVALAAHMASVPIDDEDGLETLLQRIKIEFHDGSVHLNGEDVSLEIRTPLMDKLSSAVSRVKVVRTYLARLQRQFGQRGRLVAEGRDMGTVVFPKAKFKFFLTASCEERARRRCLELKEKGLEVSFEQILQAIRDRDQADSSRELCPLKPAKDAIIIDSSNLSVEEVIKRIVEHVKGERI